jgi:hypothetical protein
MIQIIIEFSDAMFIHLIQRNQCVLNILMVSPCLKNEGDFCEDNLV